MSEPVPVDGFCDPRFSVVREVFEKKVAESEVGASIAFMLDGEMVVDLWGGFTAKDKAEPWGRDTIANTYSTTKGMTALVAHRLVEQGKIDLDAPVASYWPEFAAEGKQDVPVRWLLSASTTRRRTARRACVSQSKAWSGQSRRSTGERASSARHRASCAGALTRPDGNCPVSYTAWGVARASAGRAAAGSSSTSDTTSRSCVRKASTSNTVPSGASTSAEEQSLPDAGPQSLTWPYSV